MNTISKIIVATIVTFSAVAAQAATKVVQLETVVVTAKRVVASNDVRTLPTVVVVASRNTVQLAQATGKTRKA